jgi:hypothetical protein
LIDQYQGDLIVIRYHVWWPSANDPFYLFNIPENRARRNYYGISGIPYNHFDGIIESEMDSSFMVGAVADRLAIPSPLEISIAGTYAPDSREVNLVVTAIGTDALGYADSRLHLVVAETGIYWEAPNGLDFHNQTMRDMVPDSSGLPIDISPGDTATFDFQFAIYETLNADSCQFVAFVQANSAKEVLQAAKIDLADLRLVGPDLTAFDLILPADGDTIETCYPHCVWTSSADTAGGPPVSYQVCISGTPDFEVQLVSDTLMDTSWTCPNCLPYGATEYWKVIAFNGYAPDRPSEQVFTFTVYTPEGCDYAPGDVNDVPPANGIDVTYGVAYLKGGIPPPVNCGGPAGPCPQPASFYAAMDVNGSCAANGIDITYFVGFLKGGPPLMYCPSCPPIE